MAQKDRDRGRCTHQWHTSEDGTERQRQRTVYPPKAHLRRWHRKTETEDGVPTNGTPQKMAQKDRDRGRCTHQRHTSQYGTERQRQRTVYPPMAHLRRWHRKTETEDGVPTKGTPQKMAQKDRDRGRCTHQWHTSEDGTERQRQRTVYPPMAHLRRWHRKTETEDGVPTKGTPQKMAQKDRDRGRCTHQWHTSEDGTERQRQRTVYPPMAHLRRWHRKTETEDGVPTKGTPQKMAQKDRDRGRCTHQWHTSEDGTERQRQRTVYPPMAHLRRWHRKTETEDGVPTNGTPQKMAQKDRDRGRRTHQWHTSQYGTERQRQRTVYPPKVHLRRWHRKKEAEDDVLTNGTPQRTAQKDRDRGRCTHQRHTSQYGTERQRQRTVYPPKAHLTVRHRKTETEDGVPTKGRHRKTETEDGVLTNGTPQKMAQKETRGRCTHQWHTSEDGTERDKRTVS
ncbi:hypothetical protein ACOMHN_039280 [Nucella lapillus]